MRFAPTELPEVILIEPDVYRDARGFFVETFREDLYRSAGIEGPFVQDNHSQSVAGTLRGLHLQVGRPQGKLIRVVEGRIYDVAVDVRRGSPKFGRWIGIEMSGEDFKQCYIPPGFAHGFCVLSAVAQVEYKCTDFYSPAHEVGIAWNDPALGIAWPVEHPLLSDRDRLYPRLEQLTDRLPQWLPT